VGHGEIRMPGPLLLSLEYNSAQHSEGKLEQGLPCEQSAIRQARTDLGLNRAGFAGGSKP